jgi:hypothetical protein
VNKNELLHTFGVYNAILTASNGTQVYWNNTLGFSLTPFGTGNLPPIDLKDHPRILGMVDDFVNQEARS